MYIAGSRFFWPDALLRDATPELLDEHFGALVRGPVTRYEIPTAHGLNFVLERALDGGVSMTLRVDPHGKSFQSLVLDIDL